MKSMVRIEYQGVQKKTKKNLNCFNPKYYEVIKFNLKSKRFAEETPDEKEFFTIQVIMVEANDTWKIIA